MSAGEASKVPVSWIIHPMAAMPSIEAPAKMTARMFRSLQVRHRVVERFPVGKQKRIYIKLSCLVPI